MTCKQQCVVSCEGITVIVPVKVSNISYLSGFADCYRKLLAEMSADALQLLVVDDSPEQIYSTVDSWFAGTRATHFRPSWDFSTGANGKLNSVRAALSSATHDMVLLLDDDFRPTTASITSFQSELTRYACLKGMVSYISPTLTDLVNSCGIFFVNVTSPQRQFCGHIGFHQSAMNIVGFPSSDGLFDELVVEEAIRKSGKPVGYARCVFLELITHGRSKFLEQRIRYAYENLAYPLRFMRDLLIAPLLVGAAFLGGIKASFLTAALISLACMIVCLVGQLRFGGSSYPKWTFVLAPLWYWPYTICSWIAIGAYLTGGISFGGRRVRHPV